MNNVPISFSLSSTDFTIIDVCECSIQSAISFAKNKRVSMLPYILIFFPRISVYWMTVNTVSSRVIPPFKKLVESFKSNDIDLIPLWLKVLTTLDDNAPDEIKAEDLKQQFISNLSAPN